MNILIILIAILFSSLRGIREGMTFIKPDDEMTFYPVFLQCSRIEFGVRSHDWFKHYHLFSAGTEFMAGVLGALLWLHWPGIIFLGGISIASWEIFELWYSYARYGTCIPKSENFLGLGIDLGKSPVFMIHLFRVIVAVTLTIGGIQ